MKTVGDVIHTEKSTSHRALWIVYFVLLLLLAVTVALAYVPLGRFNLFLAAFVAIVKAMLVVWYFMEMREADKHAGVFFVASIVMVLVAAILIFPDYLTRS